MLWDLSTLSSNRWGHCLLLSLSLDFSCRFLKKTSWFYLYFMRVLDRGAPYVEAAIVRSVHVYCDLCCSLSIRIILLLVLCHLDLTLELKFCLGKSLLKQGNMYLCLF